MPNAGDISCDFFFCVKTPFFVFFRKQNATASLQATGCVKKIPKKTLKKNPFFSCFFGKRQKTVFLFLTLFRRFQGSPPKPPIPGVFPENSVFWSFQKTPDNLLTATSFDVLKCCAIALIIFKETLVARLRTIKIQYTYFL